MVSVRNVLDNQISIRKQNIEQMQKVSQSGNVKSWLPSIYPDEGKRSFRSISHKSHKENIHTENSCLDRAPHASSVRFGKKMSQHLMPAKYVDLKEAFLEEREAKCVETKRKCGRPWLGRQVDPNKQTIKKEHLASLLNPHPNAPLKTNPNKKTLADSPADTILESLSATRELILNKTRGVRRASERKESVGRQKITSCKIAMKRGAFPLNKKHYQQLKVTEYFQREQSISAILKPEGEAAPEEFISIDSLLNIVF